MEVYVALAHHPVLNRAGGTVATAVTNLDIHDVARSARTYGVTGYFISTPVEQQRSLVARITDHWTTGSGGGRHPLRAEAVRLVRVVDSIEEAVDQIARQTGAAPVVIGTTARTERATKSWEVQRQALLRDAGTALLLFGTGWGLTAEALAACDVILPPIEAIAGRTGYNHLSVRSAVAIALDRLLGARTNQSESSE